MKRNSKTESESPSPEIQAFQQFCHDMAISAITGWRMRKLGWIDTVNIAGRPYITCEEVARFKARAAAGEFARTRFSPNRRTQ